MTDKEKELERKLRKAKRDREYMNRYFQEHPDQAEKNRVRARERGRRLAAERQKDFGKADKQVF